MISAYESNLFGKEYNHISHGRKVNHCSPKSSAMRCGRKCVNNSILFMNTHNLKINCLHTLKQWKVSYLASQCA